MAACSGAMVMGSRGQGKCKPTSPAPSQLEGVWDHGGVLEMQNGCKINQALKSDQTWTFWLLLFLPITPFVF